MFSLARRVYHSALYRAYRVVFKAESKDVTLVLDDLAKFCHVGQTTACYDGKGIDGGGAIDPLASQQLEGRRQVFLRIAGFMNADPQDFLEPQVEIYEDDD